MAQIAHAKNLIDQVMDPKKFDRRTHIWDSQGRLIRTNLYTEYVRDGNRYLERPVGSGNLWTEGNQPIGRVEKKLSADGIEISKEFFFDVPHKEYTPELTGDDKLRYQLEQERAAHAEVVAELAAIKAEREQPGSTLAAIARAEVKPTVKTETLKASVPKLPKED